MKIVCLGDSLTEGLDREDENHWINILHREAKNTYVNKGICGDTTGGMLARFHRDVVEEGAKCVILMGGGNDFIMGCAQEVVQANIMALVHQSVHCKVFPVLGVPVMGDAGSVRADWAAFADFGEVMRKYREYRAWLHRFSETFHVELLDFEAEFEKQIAEARRIPAACSILEHRGENKKFEEERVASGLYSSGEPAGEENPGRGDRAAYFVDGLHPNEKGNRIMANLILRAGM